MDKFMHSLLQRIEGEDPVTEKDVEEVRLEVEKLCSELTKRATEPGVPWSTFCDQAEKFLSKVYLLKRLQEKMQQ